MAAGLFGDEEVRLSKLSDVAGVLRYRERKEVRALLDEFERRFPGCFFAVYFGAQEEMPCIRQFGMWLLNHGVFEDAKVKQGNGGCVLLTIDVAAKVAGFSYGYFLEAYLDEESTFSALSDAHPFLLQGDFPQALREAVKSISRELKKHAKRSRKNVAIYEEKVRGPYQQMLEDEKERETQESELEDFPAEEEKVEVSTEAESGQKKLDAFPVNMTESPMKEAKSAKSGREKK